MKMKLFLILSCLLLCFYRQIESAPCCLAPLGHLSNSLKIFPIDKERWAHSTRLAETYGYHDNFFGSGEEDVGLVTQNDELEGLYLVFSDILDAFDLRDYPYLDLEVSDTPVDERRFNFYRGQIKINEIQKFAQNFQSIFPEYSVGFASICSTLATHHYLQKTDNPNFRFHCRKAQLYFALAHFLVPESFQYHHNLFFALKANREQDLALKTLNDLSEIYPDRPVFELDRCYLIFEPLRKEIELLSTAKDQISIKISRIEIELKQLLKRQHFLSNSPRGLSLLGLIHFSLARLEREALMLLKKSGLQDFDQTARNVMTLLKHLSLGLETLQKAWHLADKQVNHFNQKRHAKRILEESLKKGEDLLLELLEFIRDQNIILPQTYLPQVQLALNRLEESEFESIARPVLNAWSQFHQKAQKVFSGVLQKAHTEQDLAVGLNNFSIWILTLSQGLQNELPFPEDLLPSGSNPSEAWQGALKQICEDYHLDALSLAVLYAWGEWKKESAIENPHPCPQKHFFEKMELMLYINGPEELSNIDQDQYLSAIKNLEQFLGVDMVVESESSNETSRSGVTHSVEGIVAPKDVNIFIESFETRMGQLQIFEHELDGWIYLQGLAPQTQKEIRQFKKKMAYWHKTGVFYEGQLSLDVFKQDFLKALLNPSKPRAWKKDAGQEVSKAFRRLSDAVQELEVLKHRIAEDLSRDLSTDISSWRSQIQKLRGQFADYYDASFIDDQFTLAEHDLEMLSMMAARKNLFVATDWDEMKRTFQSRFKDLKKKAACWHSYTPIFSAFRVLHITLGKLTQSLQSPELLKNSLQDENEKINSYVWAQVSKQSFYHPQDANLFIDRLNACQHKLESWCIYVEQTMEDSERWILKTAGGAVDAKEFLGELSLKFIASALTDWEFDGSDDTQFREKLNGKLEVMRKFALEQQRLMHLQRFARVFLDSSSGSNDASKILRSDFDRLISELYGLDLKALNYTLRVDQLMGHYKTLVEKLKGLEIQVFKEMLQVVFPQLQKMLKILAPYQEVYSLSTLSYDFKFFLDAFEASTTHFLNSGPEDKQDRTMENFLDTLFSMATKVIDGNLRGVHVPFDDPFLEERLIKNLWQEWQHSQGVDLQDKDLQYVILPDYGDQKSFLGLHIYLFSKDHDQLQFETYFVLDASENLNIFDQHVSLSLFVQERKHFHLKRLSLEGQSEYGITEDALKNDFEHKFTGAVHTLIKGGSMPSLPEEWEDCKLPIRLTADLFLTLAHYSVTHEKLQAMSIGHPHYIFPVFLESLSRYQNFLNAPFRFYQIEEGVLENLNLESIMVSSIRDTLIPKAKEIKHRPIRSDPFLAELYRISQHKNYLKKSERLEMLLSLKKIGKHLKGPESPSQNLSSDSITQYNNLIKISPIEIDPFIVYQKWMTGGWDSKTFVSEQWKNICNLLGIESSEIGDLDSWFQGHGLRSQSTNLEALSSDFFIRKST